MKKYINRLLSLGLLAFVITSCVEEDNVKSTITSFPVYTAALSGDTPAVTTLENSTETIPFTFSLDDNQITDVSIDISVGVASTAKEGVDFELSTHHVDFAAFEGADGFTIDITILQDFEVETADESIYLVFTTRVPSGLSTEGVLVATIVDDTPVCPYDLDLMVGARAGTDITIDGLGFDPYVSEVVISGASGAYTITGLGIGWMTDFWGEVITSMEDVEMVIDENPYGAAITIPAQAYMETTYNGAPQDTYIIEGTGTIVKCDKTLIIEYSLTSFGTDWAAWTHDNGYMSEQTFTAVLTLP